MNIDAYEEGMTAYEQGKTRSANPYPVGDERRADWFHGWEAAKMVMWAGVK